MVRLKEKYENEVAPFLMKEFSFKNRLQVPRLEKIVVNVGVGDAMAEPKFLEAVISDVSLITGQRPVVTRAKKAVAAFKLRAGASIGCKVTLRGRRMYEFFDRLVNVTLPRVRDFRGVSPNSLDGKGNYTLGIKEQIVFPELSYDKVEKMRGMSITFCMNSRREREAKRVLELLGMPFRQVDEGTDR